MTKEDGLLERSRCLTHIRSGWVHATAFTSTTSKSSVVDCAVSLASVWRIEQVFFGDSCPKSACGG